MNPELTEYLSRFVTPHKLELFESVARRRTRHITVVLEDVFRSHNASACLRSCECFGIQDVHIVENRHQYTVNRDITRGASRWLTLIRHNSGENNTPTCLRSLKQQGYRIIAASPRAGGCRLEDYDVTQKTALIFGTELQGLSSEAVDLADGFLRIPTCGFTESCNISVAVALCLHHLTWKLRNSDIDWSLSADEQTRLKAAWIETAARKWLPQLEKQFHARTSRLPQNSDDR